MSAEEIYLLSGLGADRRVFDFIDLSEFKPHHIEWIEPFPKESIEDYARRLTKQISATNPVLIGVSFGGMMAVEIGKLITTEKIVLISSAKTSEDIPFLYKTIGLSRLHRLTPATLLKKVNVFTTWFFGVTNQGEKILLNEIINATDVKFLRWAIDQILNWKNKVELTNVISIHGTQDRLLPPRKPEVLIQGGGHLMIVSRAKEVGRKVREILS